MNLKFPYLDIVAAAKAAIVQQNMKQTNLGKATFSFLKIVDAQRHVDGPEVTTYSLTIQVNPVKHMSTACVLYLMH